MFEGIVESYDLVKETSYDSSLIINDKLASVSIHLLTQFFLHKSALTPKNKAQLVRHFLQYSDVSTAEQPHSGRMLKIGLFCLKLIRENANIL